MNRLTKKVSKIEAMLDYGSEYIPSENCHSEFELYYKLGKLENIEEELGCPLEVVFKALKQKHIFVEEAYCCAAGDVYKLEDKKLGYVNIDLSIEFTAVEEIDDYFKEFANRWCWQFQYNIDHDDYSWDWYLVKLTDYKKTWWLKEDRSE